MLTGSAIHDAFDRVRGMAGEPIVPRPGQSVLDELLAQVLASDGSVASDAAAGA